MRKFDLVVIGSGPAGRRAAIQAAKLGKSVVVVDDRSSVGGVSVHTGTIPSKTMRETVLNLTGWREQQFYSRGRNVSRSIDPLALSERLGKTLEHEIDILEVQFARNGVSVIQGRASFESSHILQIEKRDTDSTAMEKIEAAHILICVGTKPYRPDYVPFNDHNVLDSDAIAKNPKIPRSLTVIGAGVIGIEYATIFSAMDVPVTLIEPLDQFLGFIDKDVIDNFTHQLRDRGMSIRLGCKTKTIRMDPNGNPIVTLEDGRIVRSEMLLFAAGRMGATASMGLKKIGLLTDNRGRLKVDPGTMQTDIDHIYAAGDVIGFPSLASTSMEQGRIAACHAFGAPMTKAPEHFPYGIYAVPEISTIGLSEEEAQAKGLSYEVGIARLRETSRGHIMGLGSGILKCLFDLKTGGLLGVHIVGEGATELIHIGQAVMNLNGGIDYFIENTFNYPTLAEAYKIAALDAWNRMPGCQTNKITRLYDRSSGQKAA